MQTTTKRHGDETWVFEGIDNALAYMQLADPAVPGVIPIAHHNGAVLINTDLTETIGRARKHGGKQREVMLLDLVRKIDVAIAFPFQFGERDRRGRVMLASMERGRELSYSEKSRLAASGYQVETFARVVEAVATDVFEDGTYHSQREHYQLVAGDRSPSWKPLASPLDRRRQFDNPHADRECFSSMISVFPEFQAFRDASWAVEFAYPGSHSVSFLTDPIGIREFFRLRDVPTGKSRRQALKHWVSAHYRQLRDDPAVETQVRASLRGQTRFTWLGLNATIHIPSGDLAKLEAFKQERAVARRNRRDRRPRLPR